MEEQDYTRRSQRPKKRRLRKGRAILHYYYCVSL